MAAWCWLGLLGSAGTSGDFPDHGLEGLRRFVQLGDLIADDPDAAGLIVDILNLRRLLATLDEPTWVARLGGSAKAAHKKAAWPSAETWRVQARPFR